MPLSLCNTHYVKSPKYTYIYISEASLVIPPKRTGHYHSGGSCRTLLASILSLGLECMCVCMYVCCILYISRWSQQPIYLRLFRSGHHLVVSSGSRRGTTAPIDVDTLASHRVTGGLIHEYLQRPQRLRQPRMPEHVLGYRALGRFSPQQSAHEAARTRTKGVRDGKVAARYLGEEARVLGVVERVTAHQHRVQEDT